MRVCPPASLPCVKIKVAARVWDSVLLMVSISLDFWVVDSGKQFS